MIRNAQLVYPLTCSCLNQGDIYVFFFLAVCRTYIMFERSVGFAYVIHISITRSASRLLESDASVNKKAVRNFFNSSVLFNGNVIIIRERVLLPLNKTSNDQCIWLHVISKVSYFITKCDELINSADKLRATFSFTSASLSEYYAYHHNHLVCISGR